MEDDVAAGVAEDEVVLVAATAAVSEVDEWDFVWREDAAAPAAPVAVGATWVGAVSGPGLGGLAFLFLPAKGGAASWLCRTSPRSSCSCLGRASRSRRVSAALADVAASSPPPSSRLASSLSAKARILLASFWLSGKYGRALGVSP